MEKCSEPRESIYRLDLKTKKDKYRNSSKYKLSDQFLNAASAYTRIKQSFSLHSWKTENVNVLDYCNSLPETHVQRRSPPVLPPIYMSRPRPFKTLQQRDIWISTEARGPISDEEWQELKQCRYLRSGLRKFWTGKEIMPC